jgi:hypothetical protein
MANPFAILSNNHLTIPSRSLNAMLSIFLLGERFPLRDLHLTLTQHFFRSLLIGSDALSLPALADVEVDSVHPLLLEDPPSSPCFPLFR